MLLLDTYSYVTLYVSTLKHPYEVYTRSYCFVLLFFHVSETRTSLKYIQLNSTSLTFQSDSTTLI